MSETVNVVIAGTPTPIVLYDSNTLEAARQAGIASTAASAVLSLTPFAATATITGTQRTRVSLIRIGGVTDPTVTYYLEQFAVDLGGPVGARSVYGYISRVSDNVRVCTLTRTSAVGVSGVTTYTVPASNSSGLTATIKVDMGNGTETFTIAGTGTTARLDNDRCVIATALWKADVNTAGNALIAASKRLNGVAGNASPLKTLPLETSPTTVLGLFNLSRIVFDPTLTLPANICVREFGKRAADDFFRCRIVSGDGSTTYVPLCKESLNAGVQIDLTATPGDRRIPLYAENGNAFGVPQNTIVGHLEFNAEAAGVGFGTYAATIDWAAGALDTGLLQPETSVINTIAAAAVAPVATALAPLVSPWGPKAVSIPAYAKSIIKNIKIWSGKGLSRDLYVSFVQTSTAQLRISVSDPVLNDEVGYFQLSTPNYTSGGANLPARIALIGSDPLGALPSGDPNGANYSGLQGYIELNNASVIESGATYSSTSVTETQINPNNIYNIYSTPARVRDTRLWQYSDVIEAGPGKAYTTPRAAVEALYDSASVAAMAAQTGGQLGVAVQPTSFRATPLNPVLIVVDLPNAASPLQPWQDVNLHLPDYVSLISRYPNAVYFEHSPGATRPILQAHLSHQIVDINWRNTVAEGTDYASSPTTSSARYAIHRDFFHLFQTTDAEGNLARASMLQIIGGSLLVGPSAAIQPFGSAITVQDTVEIIDTILNRDNSYAGAFVSANNSSSAIGGGQFVLRNVWDKSGRASNVSTVAVQTKTNATYANWLNIDSCKNITQVSLSPGTLGNFVGKWLLRGNNPLTSANIVSTIPGDTMGL